jgi:hypothetical protein
MMTPFFFLFSFISERAGVSDGGVEFAAVRGKIGAKRMDA